ncbi:hypothetical protein PG988_001189 [Apiospora saccharicola]
MTTRYLRKKLFRASASGSSQKAPSIRRPREVEYDDDDDDNDDDNDLASSIFHGPGSERLEQQLPGTPDARPRTRFSPIGCDAWAYPSAGGVVYGLFTAVQLKQMRLSNLEEADRPFEDGEGDDDDDDAGAVTDEDRLSLLLLRHGARWWPSWGFYCRHRDNVQRGVPYGFHFPPSVHTAYTAPEANLFGKGKGRRGEVWVLKGSEDARDLESRPAEGGAFLRPALPRLPEDWYARVNMATTPGERCKVFKRFDATYYQTLEECEDIPKTLEDGIQKGKEYEALLRRMEDRDYVHRWVKYGSTEWPVRAYSLRPLS